MVYDEVLPPATRGTSADGAEIVLCCKHRLVIVGAEPVLVSQVLEAFSLPVTLGISRLRPGSLCAGVGIAFRSMLPGPLGGSSLLASLHIGPFGVPAL